MLDKPLFANTV